MIKNNKKAFTIIEVVLVLAIAGLIFLMVFIALPALQRGQRNTRRRQDMARIMSAITDYQTNNNNNPPVTLTDDGKATLDVSFPSKYVEPNLKSTNSNTPGSGNIGRLIYSFECQDDKTCDHFMDPDGEIYKVAASGAGYSTHGEVQEAYTTNFDHVVYIIAGAKCGGSNEGGVINTNNKSEVVVRYVLEGGSVYCNDNQ